MNGFIHGIPLIDALTALRTQVKCVAEEETVALAQAQGRITARAIESPVQLPAFARSTVDGYAVHSFDTFGAEEGCPALLHIAGEVLMGVAATGVLSTGAAVRISTGGMLPAEADAVVMVEHVETVDAANVLVGKRVAPGENVIAAGEDVAANEVLLPEGTLVTAACVGLLAACGVRFVPVRRILHIGLFSTGDELTEAERPLAPGEVRDCNRPMLSAALRRLQVEPVDYGIVRDDAEQLAQVLAQAVHECDAVLLSGGSSMGQRDYAAQTIAQMGPPGLLAHGLAIKPGRPTIIGQAGDKPIVGLPGHPAAAMTVFYVVVEPIIRHLRGEKEQAMAAVPARLARNVASSPGRDDFISVKLRQRPDGLWAEPIFGRSGLVSVMAQGDGLVHIASERGGHYEGEIVLVLLPGVAGWQE